MQASATDDMVGDIVMLQDKAFKTSTVGKLSLPNRGVSTANKIINPYL